MAAISVGSAVGAGFQLIVRRPVAVVTWGVVRVGFALVVLALYAPVWSVMLPHIHEMMGNWRAVAGHHPMGGHPSQMLAFAQSLRGAYRQVPYYAPYWIPLVQLLVGSMIICAATRAIVHPRQGVIAYLRIGGPEIFLAFILILAVIAYIAVVLAFVFGLHGIVGFMTAQHMGAATRYVVLGAALLFVAAIVYVLLRFAFVVPMMVDDGRFHLFGSWGRTRGRVVSLLLIGLALFVIELIVAAALSVSARALAPMILRSAGGEAGIMQLLHQPNLIIAKPPLMLLGALAVVAIIDGCLTAIFIAPWARAYRDVAPAKRRGPLMLQDSPPAPEPQAPQAPPPSDFPQRLDHDEPPAHAETLAPAAPAAEAGAADDSAAPEGDAVEPDQAEHVSAAAPQTRPPLPRPEPLHLIEPLRLNPPISENGDEPARGI